MGHEDDTQFIHHISMIESSLLDFQPSYVDDFYQQYNEYTNALEVGIRANILSPPTTALATALSIKVFHTVESSLEVESLSKKLMGSFLDETAAILGTMDTPPPLSHISESTLAPYIKPSYEWLVANIHKPYPSSGIRDAIARKSGAARKDVDNWFMDARKRIGWNDARKTYFCNKRADIIDAAARFYANDEKLSLSQGAEYALISIMKNAKDLYRDKFNQSTLASKLDAAVKDLTPQTKAAAKAERLLQLQMEQARDSYPSPERSPEPADPPPASCNNNDNTTIHLTSITDRKRRNIPVESVYVDQVEDIRVIKRARLDELSSSSFEVSPFPTGLPSPVSSIIDEPLQAAEPFDLSSSSQPTLIVPSRRRRSLESDTEDEIPRRPGNLPHGPHSQAVSDPFKLPMSSALFDAYSTPFDGWFEESFDLPKVFDGGTDALTGFDFELGTFPDVDYESLHAGEFFLCFLLVVHTHELRLKDPSPEDEQALELSAPPEFHWTTSAKNFSFGELQSLYASPSIDSDDSGEVSVILRDTCVPSLPSLEFDLLDHTSGFYPSSVIDSVTKPYLFKPDFTWGSLDMSTPLTCDGNFGITPGKPLVPENCLGFLAARSSYYDVNSTRTLEQARAEKIMQLLKMKEDALKLELELATT
ncbi:hypothetical protein C0995_016450 [Termitomyces sp. Mi166|nr:hypothetical protein C0995_016450 [Termitomyces sp. Mi166\